MYRPQASISFWSRQQVVHNAEMGHPAVTIAASWQFAGYVMALYLAGLRGINAELKEAAAIDGANTWQLYRRIIIPLLMPVTFTAIVLTGMGSIRVFDIPAVLGRGRHSALTCWRSTCSSSPSSRTASRWAR